MELRYFLPQSTMPEVSKEAFKGVEMKDATTKAVEMNDPPAEAVASDKELVLQEEVKKLQAEIEKTLTTAA